VWPFAAGSGKRVYRTVHDFSMALDLSIDYQRQLCLGLYETETTKRLLSLLRPGALFIDVGANIGYYTLLASRRLGVGGHVLSFEADPSNAEQLKENVLLNSCPNVSVRPKAVTEHAGKVHLVTGEHSVGSSIETDDGAVQKLGPAYVGSSKKVIEVDSATLDEECVPAAAGGFSFKVLKMDIEGAEPLALRGGCKLLRLLDAVIVEINDFMLEVHGFSHEDVFAPLREAGFQVYSMGRARKSRPLPVSGPFQNGNHLCLK
jgi:FkbM family methyltransferase